MTGTSPPGDPRLEAALHERDIRPVVDRARSGLSNLAIIGFAIVMGLVLFTVLNARRQATSAPAVRESGQGIAAAAPPLLYLPVPPAEPPIQSFVQPAPILPSPAQTRSSATPQSAPASSPVSYQPPSAARASVVPPARNSGGAALVVDTSQANADANSRGGNENSPLAAPTSTGRVRAGFLANRVTTVAQGTLIPAVLETAFDSTRPGFARALVQRDIRGFDGTQVLIPRGSRLIGEYAADTAQGQNRAMIAWSRLIRPDGVTIAIGSPVADPVGRGGVRADVNNHFLARFAGAILQSTLDIGVNLASRSSGSPTIVALPGSVQSGNLIQTPANIRPTLRVAPGTSVSVFVARDLDFTDTDGAK